MHLYQGRNLRLVITQLVYASCFVGLILITHNILAVIGAHIFNNVLQFLRIWSHTKTQDDSMPAKAFGTWKKMAYIIFIGINLFILYLAAAWLFVSISYG
jgi:hypothetical protein